MDALSPGSESARSGEGGGIDASFSRASFDTVSVGADDTSTNTDERSESDPAKVSTARRFPCGFGLFA